MNSKKDFSDLFDENFEVTYDEDPGVSYGFTGDGTGNHSPYTDASSRYSDGQSSNGYEDYRDDYDDEYDSYSNSGYDSSVDEEDSASSDSRSRRSGKRRRSGVHLAAPIQKGGRTLSRISGILVRQLTLILILAVSVYVTYTFWRASTPYGDITESIRQKSFSQTLLAYLSVAAVFLLFEMISFFWSMTRVRVRDAGGVWKEDTGRGLTSFIIVFVASYLAFLLNGFVPSSPDVLFGFKGALLVYGSMHNTLLGLCAAGVVSCLVRRYLSR